MQMKCEFCDKEGSVATITEDYESFGVTVQASYYKCADCGQQWLSSRQESGIDMKTIRALHRKIIKEKEILDMFLQTIKTYLEYNEGICELNCEPEIGHHIPECCFIKEFEKLLEKTKIKL